MSSHCFTPEPDGRGGDSGLDQQKKTRAKRNADTKPACLEGRTEKHLTGGGKLQRGGRVGPRKRLILSVVFFFSLLESPQKVVDSTAGAFLQRREDLLVVQALGRGRC